MCQGQLEVSHQLRALLPVTTHEVFRPPLHGRDLTPLGLVAPKRVGSECDTPGTGISLAVHVHQTIVFCTTRMRPDLPTEIA